MFDDAIRMEHNFNSRFVCIATEDQSEIFGGTGDIQMNLFLKSKRKINLKKTMQTFV